MEKTLALLWEAYRVLRIIENSMGRMWGASVRFQKKEKKKERGKIK